MATRVSTKLLRRRHLGPNGIFVRQAVLSAPYFETDVCGSACYSGKYDAPASRHWAWSSSTGCAVSRWGFPQPRRGGIGGPATTLRPASPNEPIPGHQTCCRWLTDDPTFPYRPEEAMNTTVVDFRGLEVLQNPVINKVTSRWMAGRDGMVTSAVR